MQLRVVFNGFSRLCICIHSNLTTSFLQVHTMTCFFELVELLEQFSKWPLWTSFGAQNFLGLKWQKDNTSVENLECKSTNTNGSVCTVWFQVSNRLYYSCYHLSIRGLRQWNFCIYHVTRQLLEHFCKLHSAKMRHIVEYAEVTVTGNSLVWSTMLHYFFMNFFALRCSREELELTKVT